MNIAGHQVISATAPSAAPVAVGWEWADTANALLKLCTSIAPYTFVTMGGGVPAAHAASHAAAGSDPVTLSESQITGLTTDLAAKEVTANKNAASGYAGLSAGSKLTGSQQTYGTGSNTAAEGNDSRLSDARTPTAHKTSHQDGGSDEISVAGLSGVLADPQPPIIGATSITAVAGNDSRLSKTTTYVPTLTDAVNNSQTALIAFTVPANDMADGDILNITFASLLKNNKGTLGTAELLVDWGGVTVPLTDGAGGYAWSNNATERKWLYRIALMRVGADLWAYAPVTSTALSIDFLGSTNPTVAYSGAQVCTPNFASSATVAVKITLSATDATFYFKPLSAYVVRGH